MTVAIAAYERCAALAVALESLLAQTRQDFEAIVVGDATGDASAEVVRGFGDPRLRFENLAVRAGHQAGPNRRALELARAPFVAYLGQDDLWLPRHLESLLALTEGGGAPWAMAGVFFPPPPGSGAAPRVWGLAPWGDLRPDEHVPPSGWLHRSRLADEIGGWRLPADSELPPDVDLLTRARRAGVRPAASGEISVVKLSASERPGSYLERDAAEQRQWLSRLRASPDLAHELAIEALRALQRELPERHTIDREALAAVSAADWDRHWRAVRGLDAAAPTPPLVDEREEGRGPRLALRAPLPVAVGAGERFFATVRVDNPSRYRLATELPNPVQLGYHWTPAAESAPRAEGRTALVPPLPPGGARDYAVRIVAPREAGAWRLRVALVQEFILWFDAEDESVTQAIEVRANESSGGGREARERG